MSGNAVSYIVEQFTTLKTESGNETHVWSSTTLGAVAPSVKSKTLHYQHLWLKADDGSERRVILNGPPFACEGQKLSMVSATLGGEQRALLLRNLATGESYRITGFDAVNELIEKHIARQGGGLFFVVNAIGAFLVIAVLGGGSAVAGMVGIVVGLAWAIFSTNRHERNSSFEKAKRDAINKYQQLVGDL